MKSKENDKAETGKYDNVDNIELDLIIPENELYSWLISSAYQNYSQEHKNKKIKKSIKNKSKKSINKKQKGA